MRTVRDIECFLTDMDGVLVHEEVPLPGAADLIDRWVSTSKRFLVLTNNSMYTARDLAARLARSGLNIPEENIWTSALATADFLKHQPGDKTAYVIGEVGLTTAMIGDRMDTDIVAGMEAGLLTVLVLTGVTTAADVETYPFRPDLMLGGVADLVELI